MTKSGSSEWPPQTKYPKATQDVKDSIELRQDGTPPALGVTFENPENTLNATKETRGIQETLPPEKSALPFSHKGNLAERDAVLERLHEKTLPLSLLQAQGNVEDFRFSQENPSSHLGVTFENITATPEINHEGTSPVSEREPGPPKDTIASPKKDEKTSRGSASHTNVSHHKGGEERKKIPWVSLAVAGASLFVLFFVRIWQMGSSLFEALRDAARQGDAPAKQAKKESGGGHAH
jgi:hypothetical protein